MPARGMPFVGEDRVVARGDRRHQLIFAQVEIEDLRGLAQHVVGLVVGGGETFGAEGLEDAGLLEVEEGRADRVLERGVELALHHHRIVRDRRRDRDGVELGAVDGLARDEVLEDRLRQRAGLHLAVLHRARHRVMRAEMDDAVVLVAVEPGAQQECARDQVARGRGLVAVAEILALDVGHRLHRPVRLRDDDRIVERLAALDADRERLDVGRLRLRQHIGERPEIGDLDAAEAHRLDHRRIVGGDDELDRLLQRLFEIGLQRLRVLDQRRGVLVGQQRDPQPRRIERERAIGCESCSHRSGGDATEKFAPVHA